MGGGGQGSVTAAELIAFAAFKGGVYAQAFPAFGVERRGAPVQAFVRFNDRKIRLRSQCMAINTPNLLYRLLGIEPPVPNPTNFPRSHRPSRREETPAQP
jgi:hypothetical protein